MAKYQKVLPFHWFLQRGWPSALICSPTQELYEPHSLSSCWSQLHYVCVPDKCLTVGAPACCSPMSYLKPDIISQVCGQMRERQIDQKPQKVIQVSIDFIFYISLVIKALTATPRSPHTIQLVFEKSSNPVKVWASSDSLWTTLGPWSGSIAIIHTSLIFLHW